MADHVLATVDNPSAALTDFTLIVDLSDMPAAWWNAIDTTDFTRGRGYKGDGTTRLACDWIDPVNNDDGTGTGQLRTLWSGTLATTGTQQLWIEPPLAANATVAASATYGSDNAYDASWEGYWPLEEDPSGTAPQIIDRTSHGRDGTSNGSMVSGDLVTGQVGQALDFDGTQYISLGTGSIGDGTALTVIGWANSDTGDQGRLLSKHDSGDYGFLVYRKDTDDSLGFAVSPDGSTWPDPAGVPNAWPAASWRHLAAVYDGSHLRLYAQGSEATGGDFPYAYTSDINLSTQDLQIGGDAFSARMTDGRLDGVQVHSAARTAAWISQEYSQTNDNATFWGTWTWISGGTTVSVSALDHTHTLDTVSITQTQNIGVADSYHAHALDSVAIQQINNITIESLFHAHELDSVTITQAQNVVIDSLHHEHSLDATGITQRHNISVDELSHIHELDTVAVSLSGEITAIADDLFHAHLLDSVGITQRQNVTVADLYHGHVVDGASLSPRVTVSIADLFHAHEIDGVDYTQAHVIIVDDLTHEQSHGTVSLTQRHFLTIQDLVHAHGLDAVNFTIAEGIVTLTFTDKSGSAVFTGKTGSATFTDKTGRIVWTQ